MRPNYLDTEKDRLCAIESIKYARKLAATDALKPFIESEYKPGGAVQSDSDILEFARENGATIFHPTGTCKMGSDPMAVTDANLRVHGIAGLRIVDCSIMPTLVSGNTHAPAVMIAEKASDMILAAAKNESMAA
jgi:choline dehydrogenase